MTSATIVDKLKKSHGRPAAKGRILALIPHIMGVAKDYLCEPHPI